MTRKRPDHGSAGFTLLEALVATLLMTFIFAALAAVTAQWLPSWNRGFMAVQRVEITATGLDRLADDLAAAEFVSATATSNAPFFDGQELSVIFVRSKLEPNAGRGLEVVRIAEIGDDAGPTLVRSTAPLPTGPNQSPDLRGLEFANPVVVMRPPYRVSFEYSGPDRVWHDSWRGQTQLPGAVRIKVRDNATSTLLTVTTTAFVHAQLPARCTWPSEFESCTGIIADAQSRAPANNGPPGGL
jgi:general secretion pathway protein J